jgi:hypothetical protein
LKTRQNAHTWLIKLFGRGGLELLPLLKGNFRDLIAEVEKLGVAFTDDGAKKAAAYDDALDKLHLRWEALKRSFGEKIIGVIDIVTQAATGNIDGLPGDGDKWDPKEKKWVKQKWEPAKPKGDEYQKLVDDLKAAGQTMPGSGKFTLDPNNLSGGAIKSPDQIRKELLDQNNREIANLSAMMSKPEDKLKALDSRH